MIPTHTVEALLQKIDEICSSVEAAEESQKELLDAVHPAYRKSAANLLHYRAFRGHDLRKFQVALRNLGMSRFAHAEGHIKASLMNSRIILHRVLAGNVTPDRTAFLSLRSARSLLRDHTRKLLGRRPQGRRVRIMVTLPGEAAGNYQMVLHMARNGMDVARINCAHDTPKVWKQLIDHVRKASEELEREIKVSMDLAGPKLRTGPMAEGPQVLKFGPKKDVFGRHTEPAVVYLVPDDLDAVPSAGALPITRKFFSKLREGDKIRFKDIRGKKRSLVIQEVTPEEAIAHAYKKAYVESGTRITLDRGKKGHKSVIGSLPALAQYLTLQKGDTLRIYEEPVEGTPATYDDNGHLLTPACLSLAVRGVVKRIMPGDPILFDDGKIEGKVLLSTPEYVDVRITRASVKGAKLRAEKGVNLPATDLGLSGLTAEDKENLKFIAKHADIVNVSFVNTAADVTELIEALDALGVRDKLSVILKIETRKAFENLVSILLEGMRTRYLGVMIARGDLAVETGWDDIGRVQEEILSFCAAAHVPVIWATQVLENMAKNGLPSRSEITDATASLKAECVMLNKGDYITEAIKLLNHILTDMERYRVKKERMLPRLEQR